MPEPFDISIWERATQLNKVAIEKNRKKVLNDLSSAIHQLSQNYHWDELYIFGSITRPEQFGKHSDIDVGIQGLDKFMHYRLVADISGMLDRDVDVIRLEDCGFAETIKTRGILWKKRD